MLEEVFRRPNKHYQYSEARRNSDLSQPESKISLKTTSPDKIVKTESFRRKTTKLDSPGLSRRLKHQTWTRSENLLNLRKPAVKNSPVGKNKFKTLLRTWEEVMNPELTQAVTKPSQKPNYNKEMDSQSDQRLENLENKGPSAQLMIGQKNPRQGGQEQSSQWRDVLENQRTISKVVEKL